MTALAMSGRAWWKVAANPPCAGFCEENHAAGELRAGGGMSCAKTIAKTDDFKVGINQYHGCDTELPDVIITEPVQIYIWVPALNDEYLSPDDAARILSDVNAATALAIQEAREANR